MSPFNVSFIAKKRHFKEMGEGDRSRRPSGIPNKKYLNRTKTNFNIENDFLHSHIS